MKKLFYCALPLLAIAACNVKDPESNMGNIHTMEDSVMKRYATVNRVSIEVKEFSEIIVTLGDKELYNATPEKQQQVAEELGELSVYLFEANNNLEKGSVIYVANETTLDVSDKKVSDMHLQKFLKHGGK